MFGFVFLQPFLIPSDRGGLGFDWRPIAAALEQLAFKMRRVSVTDDGPQDDDPDDHHDPDDDDEDAA